MILVGLGSNQPSTQGSPWETVEWALLQLDNAPLRLVAASTLIETPPFGKTDQPDYINAVAHIETVLGARALLLHLQKLELAAGRVRRERWGPRTLDLDIIDFNGTVMSEDGLSLPHPGVAERRFVLEPIAEIAPRWRHPVTGLRAAEMLTKL
jgi:2-amino-4-hydroxy-6-hydroxymethyldihydropteridine diphosphokinase